MRIFDIKSSVNTEICQETIVRRKQIFFTVKYKKIEYLNYF